MPYYSDISMIGKHFLVRSLASPRIKRQYTVTNCMKEEVYQEYLRVIRERLDYGSNSPFN